MAAADTGRAEALYERMSEFAPGYPDVWWQLAGMQMHRKDYPAVRRSLSAMLEVTLDQGSPQADHGRARRSADGEPLAAGAPRSSALQTAVELQRIFLIRRSHWHPGCKQLALADAAIDMI